MSCLLTPPDLIKINIDSLQIFKYYNESRPIVWPGGSPPRAEPVCGFRGEKCISKTDWRVIITVILVVLFILIGGIMAFK